MANENFFSKIWSTIKTWALTVGAEVGIEKGAELLDDWLENLYAKKPKTAAYLVIAIHAGIDEALETLVAKTETKLDDKAVAAIKKEISDFAAKHGIQLINLELLPAPVLIP